MIADESSSVAGPSRHPMLHSRVHIEAGDLVILYMARDAMTAITVTPGTTFHNKYGRYAHDEIIGMKFGSKMHSPPPESGYLHLLRPTPELWTLSLPHRTQILYSADISYILMRLAVRAGGTVVEAGTGSGSMTHALARAVGDRGTVHSFEYHRQRFEAAGAEFESHGLANVQLRHQNVCKDGFAGVTKVESVFLDLPAPWEAIPHTLDILRDDMNTRVCCFSPCLEQVLKTVSALREHGFTDIFTQEVLVRSWDLVPPAPSPHRPALNTVSGLTAHLRAHETKKEERRLLQIARARERTRERRAAQHGAKAAPAGLGADPASAAPGISVEEEEQHAAAAAAGGKRKADDVSGAATPLDDGHDAKRAKVDADATAAAVAVAAVAHRAPDSAAAATPDDVEAVDTPDASATEEAAVDLPLSARVWHEPAHCYAPVLARPAPDMRGHTSYLTFATLHPRVVREAISAQGSGLTSRIESAAALGDKAA